MFFLSRYYKKCKISFYWVCVVAILLAAFLMPCVKLYKSQGFNMYKLIINGAEMGLVKDEAYAQKLLTQARRDLSSESKEMVFIDCDVEVQGLELLTGKADPDEILLANIKEAYKNSTVSTMQHAYTVKIDKFMINVPSAEDVVALLEASLGKYDTEGKFSVELVADTARELPVLVPVIINNSLIEEKDNEHVTAEEYLGSDGMFKALDEVLSNIVVEIEPDFDDYDYGITEMSFNNNVEVVEAYIPTSQIQPLSTAIDDVTKEKEQKTIYEVVSGDTLSGIAYKTGITVSNLIELNESLTSENSIIRVGDELTITVPQPELGVRREELKYYEGTYEAAVIYQYNDDWYTTKEVVLQEPSSGYHKAVEKTSYLNGDSVKSEIIREDIIVKAIPKIVEKGTKIPPTYIKPISGGRITDGYGSRASTMRGMSSFHKAVDWGTPVGTSVVASCGGTITHAGWMSSYGYCVFIKHPDGRETRYAHLSRVLVSKGQSVSQGQKIGLSGNTGVSTGPHLHFEMRINGVAVNPLKYLN